MNAKYEIIDNYHNCSYTIGSRMYISYKHKKTCKDTSNKDV